MFDAILKNWKSTFIYTVISFFNESSLNQVLNDTSPKLIISSYLSLAMCPVCKLFIRWLQLILDYICSGAVGHLCNSEVKSHTEGQLRASYESHHFAYSLQWSSGALSICHSEKTVINAHHWGSVVSPLFLMAIINCRGNTSDKEHTWAKRRNVPVMTPLNHQTKIYSPKQKCNNLWF